MKTLVQVLLLNLMCATILLAKPAKKEALDKATVEDEKINSVHPEKILLLQEDDKSLNDTLSNNSDEDFHTSVSFGTPTTQVIRPGPAFARIIDDIFQIPIGVLQSVARLLRNPFLSNKTPEKTNSY